MTLPNDHLLKGVGMFASLIFSNMFPVDTDNTFNMVQYSVPELLCVMRLWLLSWPTEMRRSDLDCEAIAHLCQKMEDGSRFEDHLPDLSIILAPLGCVVDTAKRPIHFLRDLECQAELPPGFTQEIEDLMSKKRMDLARELLTFDARVHGIGRPSD